MYEQILYEVSNPIATITFNRPDRLNAMTDRMGDELKHAIARAEADPAVAVIVITGAGRGFCAGADLKGLQAISAGERGREHDASLDADPGDAAMAEDFRGPYSYMFSVRKPIVAAINGPVAGLGLAAAMFADMRFASERAVFTTAFSRRGLIAEWGIGWTLPRIVGPSHALDLLWSARKVDAAEAERIGLANRVFPHDELLPGVRAWAEDVAAHCSPTSLQVMKRQVWTSMTRDLGPAMTESLELMRESFDRPDFKEGVDSFLEKRAPEFARIGEE